MPWQFDFDSTNKILRCSLSGRVTDAILKEFYGLIVQNAARTDPLSGVTDFSGVTSFEVSPQTLRDLARSAPAMPDPSRARVVVAPADLVFGMARMFQIEASDSRPNLHVVRTMPEAWAILGVKDPQFAPLQDA